MDFGAYINIDNLSQILKDNDIDVPRLRGLRLMSLEEPLGKEEIDKIVKDQWLWACQQMCETYFRAGIDPSWSSWCRETRVLLKKYIIFEDGSLLSAVDVNWKNIHGKKRKMFKYAFKKIKEKVYRQYELFNSYCGKSDILYIHARIGGNNWNFYDGPELAKKDWFIEKIDDSFDSTYCDIYARIKVKSDE